MLFECSSEFQKNIREPNYARRIQLLICSKTCGGTEGAETTEAKRKTFGILFDIHGFAENVLSTIFLLSQEHKKKDRRLYMNIVSLSNAVCLHGGFGDHHHRHSTGPRCSGRHLPVRVGPNHGMWVAGRVGIAGDHLSHRGLPLHERGSPSRDALPCGA